MKIAFILLILNVCCSAFAQELKISDKTGLITFDREYKLDTMKADQIYAKAYSWVVKSFRNAEQVIIAEDKPNLIKGQFVEYYPMALSQQTFWHEFQIKVKDGAAKIVIDHIENRTVGSSPYKAEAYWFRKDGTPRTTNMYQKTWAAMQANLQGLGEDLGKSLISSLGDDW